MLIVLTKKCNEKCTHCMVNALPNGEDMTMKTFLNSLEFAKKIGSRIVSISGGDPFLHSNIKEVLKIAQKFHEKTGIYFVLESNGWWRNDERMKELVLRWLDKPWILGMQVSTNKKYYTNYEETCAYFESNNPHKKINFIKDWQGVDTNLKYSGRARNIMEEKDIKGLPGCLNIVSRSRMFLINRNLKSLIRLMEESYHICTPTIYPDGSVRLGEGIECSSISNVNFGDSVNSLFTKILEFKPCDRCKACKNLTKEQKEAYL